MAKLISALTLGLIIAFSAGCTKKTDAPAPGAATSAAASSTAGKTLNLYCWANYFSPELIKRFEEKTKAKVIFTYFSSNEELLAKLQAGARGYDLIVPSSYLLKALKELSLVEPLGKLDWPELGKLSPRFKAPSFDPNHEFTIPYAWGTTGIAVNRAKTKDKVDSWSWLFDHPELKGQITMLDDATTVFGSALKYLGYAYNESSPEALKKAKDLLTKQKKWLKAYTPESQPVLESGEFVVAQAYSGDVLQVQKRGANIEYVLPKEGGELFTDTLAIPKGAPSPELAKEFMRFTLVPDVAAVQVQHLFFSPVVDIADVVGAKAVLEKPGVMPSDEQLKKFEVMSDDPERIEAIQRLWTELKSS